MWSAVYDVVVLAAGGWVILSLCLAAVPERSGFERVALLEPHLSGVPASWASEALAGFTEALEGSGRFSVLSSRDLSALLGAERQKQLLGAASSEQGAAAIGSASDARFVVGSTLKRAGGRVELRANLQDTRHGVHFEDAREVRASTLNAAARELLLSLIARLPPDPSPAPSRMTELPMPPPPKAMANALKPSRVAVLDPRAGGDIPSRALEAFTQSLAPELRKLEGISCLSSGEIHDMLSMERQRQLMGCSEDSACLAELAGAMDVEDLITVDLELVGETYSLNARRLSLSRSRVVQSTSQKFAKRDGEELLAVVGPTVAALYPERKLRPGRTRGIDEAVIRRLNPPPLPRWAFFGTLGATAVAGAASAAFALQTLQTQHDFNGLVQSAAQTPQPGSEVLAAQQRLDSNAKVTNIALGVTGGLAAVTLIEIFFTDWHNDRAAFSAQPIALASGGGVAFASSF